MTDFVASIAIESDLVLLDASFKGGKTPIIFDFFKICFNNNDGVFEPITIRSGLNFFSNMAIEDFIIFLSFAVDFVPYGKFF